MQEQNFNKEFMRLAIQYASDSCGLPKVGAVVVRDGKVIGIGYRIKVNPAYINKEYNSEYHSKIITLHAEQTAIARARAFASEELNIDPMDVMLREAVLYTTLEPCIYRTCFGNQPPMPSCAQLIIEAGIEDVVVGIVESNEEIKRKGINQLIESEVNVHLNDFGLIHQLKRLRVCYDAETCGEKFAYGGIKNSAKRRMMHNKIHNLALKNQRDIFKENKVEKAKNRYKKLPSGQLHADYRSGKFE